MNATTIHAFLNWSQGQLAQAEVLSPQLDAEVLLAHALKVSRVDLRIQSQRILNESEKNLAQANVERRRKREPVSLIVGHQEFWSLDFVVDKNVLTPRPETEVLIETALGCISGTAILDLGTGSGILPIVMAKEVAGCRITAFDIDAGALNIARENARRHEVADRIEFVCADLKKADWAGPYHMILSNPPYIKSADLKKIMPEVQDHEPQKALDGGADGLDFYKAIIPMALDQLAENGILILEIGDTQAQAVTDLLKNYRTVEVIQDYAGYDRVIKAQK